MIFPSWTSLGAQLVAYLISPLAIAAICTLGLLAASVSAKRGMRAAKRTPATSEITTPYLESFVVAFVGASIGLMAASSRTPVMGEVLPALVSSFGVFGSLYFSSKDTSHRASLVAISLCLSASTIFGSVVGAQIRDATRSSTAAIAHRAELVAYCKLQEQRAKQLVAIGGGTNEGEIDMKCSDYPRD